jgi:glycosyltransferase involved in cell wall biosynthesis
MGIAAHGIGRRRGGVPTVALLHEEFAGPTGMGMVVNNHARFILEAGWELCIIGDNVPDDLRAAAARVVRIRDPDWHSDLLEQLEWCRRARAALRQVRADIVHVHSPFLANDADLQTSHFVAQAAFARGSRETATGVEGTLRRAQEWAKRHADNRLYRRARGRTYLSFVSEFLRDEFRRHHGEPRGGWIFRPPAPPWQPPAGGQRARARAALGVPDERLAVGYLGGVDSRKGFEQVLALASEPDLHLLFAGPGSERVTVDGRPGIGFVDVAPLLSACDVLAAPTRFDPAPVAVLEGICRGVPVVTTSASGWAKDIERHGCGVVLRNGSASLADACRRAAAASAESCRAFLDDVVPERERRILIDAYAQILDARAARVPRL